MSKKLLLALLCFISKAEAVQSQEDTLTEKVLGEVVISANKFAERKKYVTQKVDVITARSIATMNSQNTGDLLINTGNVFVQKSQQGGSSPVIRGFEASRVLLVVDGIRMNNAIYRAGHLQNVITVDQNMLERVEVLYGPASTLYGSDALGGVVHLITKKPQLSTSGKLKATGTAFARFATANDEKTGHFDISLGGKRFAWLQSYTFSDFGDMKMGGNYPDDYPNFGRRDSMIVTENGVDMVVANPDTRVQKFSGYRQWDIMQKFLFRQNERLSHQLNLQHSNSSNVPRYDRLQDKRYFNATLGTTLRYAEWFYGPQTRYMASYEGNLYGLGVLDQFRVNVNYQNIEESRQQREYRRYDRFDSRIEKLNVIGAIVDARKKWNVNELTIGADAQLNDLTSTATRTNKTTGAVTPLDTRYPNGENKMNYFGVYAQHLAKLKDNKLIINDGLRLQMVTVSSTIADNSFFNLPVTKFDQSNFALTGNFGIVYLPSEDFRVTAGLSSGFRHPNIDDLARIFESNSSQSRVIIPNPDLKPEYTYNLDLGISQTIAKKIKFEITGFYTFFRNAIGLGPAFLNGEDSIVYNSVLSAVYANRNIKRARTYGFNTNLTLDLTNRVQFYGTLTYTYGRFITDSVKIPQDHIPPLFGKTSVTYTAPKFSLEGFVMFNGWKHIRQYNLDGEDNLQYATPDGMPEWFTLNFRSSFNVTRRLQLQFVLENILDRNYRYFASGFSAPGRNYVFALRSAF